MKASWLGLMLSALAFTSGCTITATTPEPDARVFNQCNANSDCSGGVCRGGACQARQGQLSSLLFEVTPPTDSELAHVHFLANVDGLPEVGELLDVQLAPTARVTGHLTLDPNGTCLPRFQDASGALLLPDAGGTLPVNVSLTPSERLLGLSAQDYLATTSTVPGAAGYVFNTAVPPGDYDVYMAPPVTQDPTCPIAPLLYRRQRIEGGVAELNLTSGPASRLELQIDFPAGVISLDGWSVEVIEPTSGRAVSSRSILGVSKTQNAALVRYDVSLAHAPVVGGSDDELGNELIRLAPPPSLVAPTISLARSGLGLFEGGPLTVKGFTRYPAPVTLEGQVAARDGGAPVVGVVTLVAQSIEGVDEGVFASFERSLQVAGDGRFRVELPPGTYRVNVVPPLPGADGGEPALAAFESTWEVPSDVKYQAGKLLEVPPAVYLRGAALDPRSGAGLDGASVQVMASPTATLTGAFTDALGNAPFVPRSISDLSSRSGAFAVQADPGVLDLSVRPPEVLGFPWFVRPGVAVAESQGLDLGRLTLPLPIIINGSATVPGVRTARVPIPSALIRAYVYLDSELAVTRPDQAGAVIQVAETRAGEDGTFRLLLPASIGSSR